MAEYSELLFVVQSKTNNEDPLIGPGKKLPHPLEKPNIQTQSWGHIYKSIPTPVRCLSTRETEKEKTEQSPALIQETASNMTCLLR